MTSDRDNAGWLVKLIWRFGPAHWPFYAAVAAAAWVYTFPLPLTRALSPTALFYLAFIVQALWLAIGGAWSVASVTAWIRPEPRRLGEWRKLKWWLAPCVVVLIILFCGNNDEVILFWTQRPELEQRLARVLAAPPTTRRVEDGAEVLDRGDAHRLPGGVVRLRCQGVGNWFDWSGYAYSAAPPRDDDIHGWWYTHLTGPWYICHGV